MGPGYCECGCGGKTGIIKDNNPSKNHVKGQPLRFIAGHDARKTLDEKFWPRVPLNLGPDECWLWQGPVSGGGYGAVAHERGRLRVHRVAYEFANGPIPEGLVIDHLCHNEDPDCPGGDGCLHRRCVNPAHLEAVPPGINTARGSKRRKECRHGHPLDGVRGNGSRYCKTCSRLYQVGRPTTKAGRLAARKGTAA